MWSYVVLRRNLHDRVPGTGTCGRRVLYDAAGVFIHALTTGLGWAGLGAQVEGFGMIVTVTVTKYCLSSEGERGLLKRKAGSFDGAFVRV
jgi:hypothetical protein